MREGSIAALRPSLPVAGQKDPVKVTKSLNVDPQMKHARQNVKSVKNYRPPGMQLPVPRSWMLGASAPGRIRPPLGHSLCRLGGVGSRSDQYSGLGKPILLGDFRLERRGGGRAQGANGSIKPSTKAVVLLTGSSFDICSLIALQALQADIDRTDTYLSCQEGGSQPPKGICGVGLPNAASICDTLHMCPGWASVEGGSI